MGAAVAMLPPRVPALRICGGPAARGGGQGRDEGGEVGAAHPRVGQTGAQQGVAVLVLPAADLADPAQADERGGPQLPGVDGGHEVGAARHGDGGRHGGERRDGLVQRGGQRHGLRRLRCVRGQTGCPFPLPHLVPPVLPYGTC